MGRYSTQDRLCKVHPSAGALSALPLAGAVGRRARSAPGALRSASNGLSGGVALRREPQRHDPITLPPEKRPQGRPGSLAWMFAEGQTNYFISTFFATIW